MWITACLLAVTFQLFRNASAKKLSAQYSPEMVSLARFAPGIPLAFLFLGVLWISGKRIAIQSIWFFPCAFAMASSQILANHLLICLFRRRNFSVSLTLVKTEAIIAAFLGIAMLNEKVTHLEWTGIGIATAGLIFASVDRAQTKKEGLFRLFFNRTSLLALGAGTGLALSSIFLKLGYTCLATDSSMMRIAFCLLLILCIQSALLAPIVLAKNRDEFVRTASKPLLPLLTGLLSVMGSFCWFLAFSLTSVANVRTLGMSEFVLSLFVTVIFFREKIRNADLIGMFAVGGGTAIMLLF